jgi:hypothetical protein
MHLDIFDETRSQIWNKINEQSQNGTLFHTWEWLKLVEKHSGSQLIPLVFFDAEDDKPFGAVPLFLMKKMGLKMVFSPPPGTSINLGPVIINKGYKQHKYELAYLGFESQIDQFVQKFKPDYSLIITSPGLDDIRPFQWNRYNVWPLYTYKLDLSEGKERIWSNLSRTLRTNINGAAKQGIKIVESRDIDSIDHVFNSLEHRFVRQGRRISISLDYLKDIFNQFGPSAIKTYLAIYKDEIVGSDICVIYKDSIMSWMGGCRHDSNNINANELLKWHEIEESIKDGFKTFEIEGANTPQLCDFKARFCPAISIYFALKKTGRIGRFLEQLYQFRQGIG